MELSYDPVIPLLGIYQKTQKFESRDSDICTAMFTAALFTIGKRWTQPKYPSVDEWMKEIWCIRTIKYYPALM